MWQAIGLYILTRGLFLKEYPHFFDGPEYQRLATMGLAEAIESAHPSIHLISLILWQVWSPQAVSAIFGLVGFLALGWVSKTFGSVSGQRKAAALFLFWPLLWLIQTNTATEAVTYGLLLSGMVMVAGKRRWLTLGGTGLMALAWVNYPGVVWWLPAWWVWGWRQGEGKRYLVVGLTAGILGTLGLIAGLGYERLGELIWGQGALITDSLSVTGAMRMSWQAAHAFVYNYGWGAVALVAYIGYKKWQEWKSSRKVDMLPVLIIAAYVVSVSYWHGGIYGRLGALMGVVLALASISLPNKLYAVVLLLTLGQWVQTVRAYQDRPIPQITQELIVKNCDMAPAIVIAESERPQLEGSWDKPTIVVGRDDMSRLEKGVCITSQALTYPYAQWDGQQKHPLQGLLGKKGLIDATTQGELEKLGEDSRTGLAIYRW